MLIPPLCCVEAAALACPAAGLIPSMCCCCRRVPHLPCCGCRCAGTHRRATAPPSPGVWAGSGLNVKTFRSRSDPFVPLHVTESVSGSRPMSLNAPTDRVRAGSPSERPIRALAMWATVGLRFNGQSPSPPSAQAFLLRLCSGIGRVGEKCGRLEPKWQADCFYQGGVGYCLTMGGGTPPKSM